MRTCPCNSQCATARLPFSRPLASVWRTEYSTRLVCHHAPLGQHNIAGSNPGPHLRAFTRGSPRGLLRAANLWLERAQDP